MHLLRRYFICWLQTRTLRKYLNFPKRVSAIQRKSNKGRVVIEAKKTEPLIAITIRDTVIRTVLMQPSSTSTGYPILSRLIVVIGNETFTVIDQSGGDFAGQALRVSDLACLCLNTCGLLSLPFLSFLFCSCFSFLLLHIKFARSSAFFLCSSSFLFFVSSLSFILFLCFPLLLSLLLFEYLQSSRTSQ